MLALRARGGAANDGRARVLCLPHPLLLGPQALSGHRARRNAQPKAAGDQLAFDDLDGWRPHAIITNVGADRMSAAEVEGHHRLRGGIPEDTIRALKNDYGMIHAPVQPFLAPGS